MFDRIEKATNQAPACYDVTILRAEKGQMVKGARPLNMGRAPLTLQRQLLLLLYFTHMHVMPQLFGKLL